MASVSHRGASVRRRPVYYANEFGVTGNGSTDDRANLQRVLTLASNTNGGADVYLRNGVYLLSRNTTTDYCVLVNGNKVRVIGESREGVILRQAASIATSVRLLRFEGDDCAALNFTLDGNKANQTVNEHRHGIIAVGAARLLVEAVTAQDFTGDGFYLHLNTNNGTVRDVLAQSCDRNGLTVGAQLYDLLVHGSTFKNNAFQQIDCEPGAGNIPERIHIIGNVADCGSGNDYSVALGGPSSAERTRGWVVKGNIITGAVYCVWCEDIDIIGNTIVNPTTKSCVEIYRKAVNVKALDNSITLTGTQTSTAGIYIQGAGTGDAPIKALAKDNTIVVGGANPAQFGIRAEASISVELRDNDMTGGSVSSALNAGIYIRPTNAAEDWDTCTVEGNKVRNFGQYGISMQGNGAARMNTWVVNENTVEDTGLTPTLTTGIRLDDGNDVVRAIEMRGNSIGTEIATKVSWPSDVAVITDYTAEGNPVYTTPIAPEGFITATQGAIALLVSGGVITAQYEKQSDKTNVGWVAI